MRQPGVVPNEVEYQKRRAFGLISLRHRRSEVSDVHRRELPGQALLLADPATARCPRTATVSAARSRRDNSHAGVGMTIAERSSADTAKRLTVALPEIRPC